MTQWKTRSEYGAILVVLALLAGCNEKTAEVPDITKQPTEALLEELKTSEMQCRIDGPKNTGEGPVPSCVKMADAMDELFARGWCPDLSRRPSSPLHWLRCADLPATSTAKAEAATVTSSASQSPSPTQSPTGELISFPKLKKMTAIGIENFKKYQVSAMINALDLGTDGLCQRLRSDGYCADGEDRIYVELRIDSVEKRSQLYDLRGKRGAVICATVVSTPQNINGNLNLVDFTSGPCN